MKDNDKYFTFVIFMALLAIIGSLYFISLYPPSYSNVDINKPTKSTTSNSTYYNYKKYYEFKGFRKGW